MARLMVLLGWFLDVLSLKSLSDGAFVRFARPSDRDYPVHRAIWGLLAAGRVDDARSLAGASWETRKSLRIGRDFIHVLLRQHAVDQAFKVAREMEGRAPGVPWIRLLAADICRFFVGDEEKALAAYLAAIPACEAAMPDVYPQAVLYKRLTSIYRRRGDEDRLTSALERFYSLAPTNFHDDEFILLAELRLRSGDRDGAREVLETGCKAMARNVPIRQAFERLGLGEAPPIRARKTALSVVAGAARIPVKTALLTEADDPVTAVRTYAGDRVRPGDTVTLSSCVGAIMEGRMLMEGTVRASFVARFLARLIAGAHQTGAFGASAPMANPLSAQTALEEVGTLRLLVAAVAGAFGKLLGVNGWFYVVSGAQVAQIDDILGSIPPYDYYAMMGPRDPSALSNRIAASLGEGVKAAIIDANDLGIAWAVGHSDGVDAKALERLMSDNPAGNQDQMTPLVIVRPETQGQEVLPEGGAGSGPAASPKGYLSKALVSVVVAIAILGTSTLVWAGRRPRAVPVPVLLYHDISSDSRPESGMTVAIREFAEQMMLLKDNGFNAITTGQLQSYLSGRGTLPPSPVLITFDDGYESVFTVAYPVLRSAGLKATAFVVGATLGTPNHLTFGQLGEMVGSGAIETGWHTYAGHGGTADSPAILSWTRDQLKADFRQLAAVSKDARVSVVPAFAYPFGRANQAETQTAREWGFTIGFTTQEGVVRRGDPPMLLKRIMIWPGNSGARFLARLAPAP